MAKRFGVVMVVALLVFGMAGTAGAAATYVYDGGVGNGTWSDVNKTNASFGGVDSLMCWAASASNALSWTGWRGWDSGGGGSYIASAGDIYSVFTSSWTNAVGSPVYAYDWWMTNNTTSVYNAAKVFPSAGLDFYPTVPIGFVAGSVSNFVQASGSNMETWLGTYVAADRAISASIDVTLPGFGTFGHALTVWGYDDALNQIYFTDSDDGMTALRTLNYHMSGNYMILEGYTNLYVTTPTDVTLDELTRLNLNDTDIEPNKGTTPPPIPEPGTMLLLGSGLVGLVGMGRRKLKK